MQKINSIIINNIYPEINVDIKRFKEGNSDLEIEGKKIAFGIDSFEDYKKSKEKEVKDKCVLNKNDNCMQDKSATTMNVEDVKVMEVQNVPILDKDDS